MERYLLFDSGCSKCSKIAHAIEQQFREQLIVQSLREPAIQELLNNASPNWLWEPTLLEVSDSKVRVYTGLMMDLRLIKHLGLYQALRLIKVVHRYHLPSSKNTNSIYPERRRFLNQSILATMGFLLFWPKSKTSSDVAKQPALDIEVPQELTVGEIYEGFLLLPTEDSSIPNFVQCAPAPILCQVDEQSDPTLIGEMLWFKSMAEIINYSPVPVYIPSILPPNIQFISAYVIRFVQSGNIFSITINFGASSEQPLVTSTAQLIYPHPFPVWPVHFPSSLDSASVYPEKVNFSPFPGVMLPSVPGYVIQWIETNVLYTLAVENYSSREVAVDITRSLIQA